MFSFGHCIIELPLPPPNLSRLVLFSPGKTMPGRKLFNGKPSLMPSYQQNHVNTTIMLSTLRCDMLGCAINANCKFCPKCKNCMSDGFCGKLCKMKNLPKQIQLYGKTCWPHIESFSKLNCFVKIFCVLKKTYDVIGKKKQGWLVSRIQGKEKWSIRQQYARCLFDCHFLDHHGSCIFLCGYWFTHGLLQWRPPLRHQFPCLRKYIFLAVSALRLLHTIAMVWHGMNGS